jgi:MFS family permease
VNASAGVSGQFYGRMTRYKTIPLFGMVLAIVSIVTLAIAADSLTPLTFEILLALIGIGFGPIPPLSSIALQNTVAIHQFGTAVGTMNFSRTLYATILIAVFGAIVLADVPAGPAALAAGAVDGFRRVFFAAAASFAVALVGLILLEEKPLKTGAPAGRS